MNGDFTPPSSTSLDALLAFIAKPGDAAKQIADLKKAVEAIEKSRAALKKETDAHNAEQVKADKTHLARVDEIAKREHELQRLDGYAAKLDARETMVSSREHELTARLADHVKREQELTDHLSEFHHKETELRNTAAALDKRAQKLAASEADYRERIARLRALAG